MHGDVHAGSQEIDLVTEDASEVIGAENLSASAAYCLSSDGISRPLTFSLIVFQTFEVLECTKRK